MWWKNIEFSKQQINKLRVICNEAALVDLGLFAYQNVQYKH